MYALIATFIIIIILVFAGVYTVSHHTADVNETWTPISNSLENQYSIVIILIMITAAAILLSCYRLFSDVI